MAEYSPNLLTYLGLGLLQSAQRGPRQNLGSNLLSSLGQYGQAAGQYQQTQAQQADAEQRKKAFDLATAQQQRQVDALGRIGRSLDPNAPLIFPEAGGTAEDRKRAALIDYGTNVDPKALLGLLPGQIKAGDFLHGNAGDSFINPNTGQKFEIPADPNDPNSKPYFSFLPTERGYAVGNNRTGEIQAPGAGGEKPLIRPQDSPGLQGSIAGAKQRGQEIATQSVAQPQANLRTNTMIDNIDRLSTAISDLDKNPGLANITGTLMGRTPNITNAATGAQAKLDSIKSQLFVDALQSMREASKTGGAVGNVSDREGDKLEAVLSALGQAQDTASFKKQLKIAQDQLSLSKARIRQAYLDTYGFEPTKNSVSIQSAPPITFKGLSNEEFLKARPR